MMNMEMPLLPLAVRSVLANTMHQSAMGAPEMKHLRPLRIKSSPSCTAVVVVPPASEPAPGSVRANTRIFSPLATAGKYFCFWASLPASISGPPPRELEVLA